MINFQRLSYIGTIYNLFVNIIIVLQNIRWLKLMISFLFLSSTHDERHLKLISVFRRYKILYLSKHDIPHIRMLKQDKRNNKTH